VPDATGTAGTAGGAELDDWTAAWTAALDDLELDVQQTELMLASSLPAVALTQSRQWVAPTGLGPIPLSLHERARRINARQLETAKRLTLALSATRRESDLAHRLSQFGPHHAPLYVDHLM
jgi:hypothetical protein